MKRVLALLIIFILLLPSLVFAADVSNALYMSTITISNNGTALSNAIAIFNLSTAEMISSGLLSANASDAAMLTGIGGSSLKFMPSVNSTYPWITWVPGIGAYSNLQEYLFTKGATGGDIAYFPGSDGMDVGDAAGMEGGNDFSDNVTYGSIAAGNVLTKGSAYNIINGTSNVTANVYTNSETLPTGFVDPSSAWTNEANAYDDNTGTYAERATLAAGATSEYLELTHASLTISGVYAYMNNGGTGQLDWVEFDYYDGSWHNFYHGAFSHNAWQTFNIGANKTVTEIRVRFHNGSGGAVNCRPYEIHFLEAIPTSVTASPVTVVERNAVLTLNGGTLSINVNGVTDSTAFAGSIVDNTDNYTIGSEATGYITRYIHKVAGVNVCDISWEYGTTFTDNSGNGNDAIPTFRTTSSDADLTASVTAIAGTSITAASTPTSNITGGASMVTGSLGTPSNLFTEGSSSYGIGDFDIGQKVEDAATGAGQDATSWHLLFAGAVAMIIMFAVFGATHNTRIGRRGSLAIAAMAAELVLIYFYRTTTVPGWMLIPFAIFALLMLSWRKSPSPVD